MDCKSTKVVSLKNSYLQKVKLFSKDVHLSHKMLKQVLNNVYAMYFELKSVDAINLFIFQKNKK